MRVIGPARDPTVPAIGFEHPRRVIGLGMADPCRPGVGQVVAGFRGASLVNALTSGMPQLAQPAGTTSGESPRRDFEGPSAFEASHQPNTSFRRGPAERRRLFLDPRLARDSVDVSPEDNPAEVFLSGLRAIGGWATHEELRAHLGWSPRKYTELLALLHHRSRVDGAPDSPTVRLSEVKLKAPWSALLERQSQGILPPRSPESPG